MQTTINRHGNRTAHLPFAAIRMGATPDALPHPKRRSQTATKKKRRKERNKEREKRKEIYKEKKREKRKRAVLCDSNNIGCKLPQKIVRNAENRPKKWANRGIRAVFSIALSRQRYRQRYAHMVRSAAAMIAWHVPMTRRY